MEFKTGMTTSIFEIYLLYFIYTLIYLALAVAMQKFLDARSAAVCRDRQARLDNLAIGLRGAGAQLGLAIGMIGVMSGQASESLADDLAMTLAYGVLAVLFMGFSLLITDRLVLPGVVNTEQLRDGNVAIGIVEFSTLVTTGVLAYASIRGEHGGLISALGYFFAGQMMLVILVLLYEHTISRSLNPVKRIEGGNVSAGLYIGGKIIAYGLILQSAIVGDGVADSVFSAIMQFVLAAFIGMLLLYVFEFLIDKFLITSSTVKDMVEQDQVVQSIQLALGKIGMALILGMAIL